MSIPKRHADDREHEAPLFFEVEPAQRPSSTGSSHSYSPESAIALLRSFEESSEDPEADRADFLALARAIDEDRFPGSHLFKKYVSYRRELEAGTLPPPPGEAEDAEPPDKRLARRIISGLGYRPMGLSDPAALSALLESWRNEEGSGESLEESLASLNELMEALGEDPIDDPRVPRRK